MVFLRGQIISSDDHIITTHSSVKEPTESVGVTIFKHMKQHKSQIAQIDAKTGKEDTFGELLQRCIRTALHMSNINRNDVVSICTKNHLNAVVPFVATQFLGAIVAPLDTSLCYEEMRHLVKQVRPKMLFVAPEVLPLIEDIFESLSLTAEIVVFDQATKYSSFCDFLKPHTNESDFFPVKITNLKDTAVIHFSSGSTGLPKGICLSHYSLVGQSYNVNHTENPDFEYMKIQARRVSFPLTQLGYTSLYWVSATTLLLSSIIQGFCRLVCEDFDGNEIWNFIETYKPVALVLTPVQAMEMLSKKRNVEVRSILSVIIVGSPISKEYSLKLQEVFPEADLSRCYGQTEVCGSLTNFRGNDFYHRPLMKREDKIESVGLPVGGVSYKVVDLESNKNLGPNLRGELRVKSKFVMNGYHKLDSSDCFDEDGWLKTGDIVYYDDDYCFYVVDRIKEAFKYKGWFIAPTFLENKLLSHPAVKQAVVIGVPKEDGCHAMGLVVVRDGFQVCEDEITRFVNERVAERQKLRCGVKFIKSVPLTITGKVKRNEIRQMVLESDKLINHG